MLVKLASSPSRLVMCLYVIVCLYLYIYTAVVIQNTEFISDHQILSLAVDASPGYHMGVLHHLPKFGFGANMGFGDMINQSMPGTGACMYRRCLLSY